MFINMYKDDTMRHIINHEIKMCGPSMLLANFNRRRLMLTYVCRVPQKEFHQIKQLAFPEMSLEEICGKEKRLHELYMKRAVGVKNKKGRTDEEEAELAKILEENQAGNVVYIKKGFNPKSLKNLDIGRDIRNHILEDNRIKAEEKAKEDALKEQLRLAKKEQKRIEKEERKERERKEQEEALAKLAEDEQHEAEERAKKEKEDADREVEKRIAKEADRKKRQEEADALEAERVRKQKEFQKKKRVK
ncbi:hypothetical protein PAPYR_13038 [Paratrimastix pyriformis]|uniref:Uncharacterized protein n=1 Tax=Paratrimastix pyriformis TaxID=342808 RepID=A0ABQ8U0Y0_9EUKA|nr:hypothetical protein PAPYR_13038 [Paratrimastix pyriformis]